MRTKAVKMKLIPTNFLVGLVVKEVVVREIVA